MGRFDKLELPGRRAGKRGSKAMSPGGLNGGESLSPGDAVERFMERAEQRFWSGDYEESLRYYSEALAINPMLEQAWIWQVMCLVRLNETREALIWVDKALDSFPQSMDLLAVKGSVYARLGDAQRAMDFSDAALNARKQSAMVWIARADALMRVHLRNADLCLKKALETCRNDWRMNALVGDTCFDHCRYRQALHYYLRSAELSDGNARIWMRIGICRRITALGDAGEAFRRAEALRPGWPELAAARKYRQPSRLVRLWARITARCFH